MTKFSEESCTFAYKQINLLQFSVTAVVTTLVASTIVDSENFNQLIHTLLSSVLE